VQLLLRSIGALMCAALTANLVHGESPYAPCPPPPTCLPYPGPGQSLPSPTAPGAGGGTDANQTPPTDAFAQAPPTGGEAATQAVPNMIGDLFGGQHVYTPVFAKIPGIEQPLAISRSASVPQGLAAGTTFTVDLFINGTRIPAGQGLSSAQAAALGNPNLFSRIPAGGSAILPLLKIVENENALPQDRFYTSYNYYNDVDSHLNPAPSQENVHREIIGFEKTLLDGDASIGLRLPFYEFYGDDLANRGIVGDLNIILKYAFLNDRENGNVASGGLVVTAPTGADIIPSGFGAPVIHATLFQPYLSGVYRFSPNFYAQGFSSIVVPTDERDVTLFDNDLGIGYFVYRDSTGDRLITSVVPSFEVHATTPLDHRGALSEPVGASDLLDLTFGLSLGLGPKSTLTFGAAVPVVGPRPFDFEGEVFLNVRF
jgi:hypothetical protein